MKVRRIGGVLAEGEIMARGNFLYTFYATTLVRILVIRRLMRGVAARRSCRNSTFDIIPLLQRERNRERRKDRLWVV